MADKSKYYQMVAEAIIAHADPIYDAIDRYLAKADEDLEDELKEEGYAEPKDTVSEINSLEEEIADILHSQTTALVLSLIHIQMCIRDRALPEDIWPVYYRG